MREGGPRGDLCFIPTFTGERKELQSAFASRSLEKWFGRSRCGGSQVRNKDWKKDMHGERELFTYLVPSWDSRSIT
ncbi:uncharacterized protein K452DRAFT_284904 [Aplosporella prunicola CBS 121167]|uniref:Uncharacterized protein n=1 Tax=Aplosporella prunicola CBS 121167 TaxID=1176127 RepID=A0A6A6BP01_9PEZI|nr:uncharacterized protein K452DRAFT_284904 [Aplosporella prunicola CBS 121167]KAF2144577.1 hypothetical protein K452DRAFT_284904 [Aplosporella prunicola CBS 121167]